jgi:drug/metabolite transporter (DMT)-like permease
MNFLGIPLSILTTAICWGVYGVILSWGAAAMGEARLRSFLCVGLAYFLIAVIVPVLILRTRGEKGAWTASGTWWSFNAGVLGALGALGIILALTSGGSPLYVMPLVFGGAPVINTFTTMVMTRNFKVNPMFLAGLILVIAGAACVLIFKPIIVNAHAAKAPLELEIIDWFKIVGSILLTVFTWGAYGPTLHKGQMAMQGSRLRPLICVGLAYFAVAVVIPAMLIPLAEADKSWTTPGFIWSLLGGTAGAIGALGIIMAFTFGGKPIYVMPLVFGGAPIINTFFNLSFASETKGGNTSIFYAGLMMSIIGAVTVLVFAPKGHGPAPTPAPKPAAPPPEKKPEAELPPDTVVKSPS